MAGHNFNVYKTDFGLFSIIIDDETYQYISSLSGNTYIIREGSPTSEYQNFINKFPLGVYSTITYRTSINSDLVNILLGLLPHTRPVKITLSDTSTTHVYPVSNSEVDSKAVITEQIAQNDQSRYGFTCKFNIGDAEIIGSQSGDIASLLPYGLSTTYLPNQPEADIVKFGFIVSDSSVSHALALELVCNSVGGTPYVTNSLYISQIATIGITTLLRNFIDSTQPVSISDDPYSQDGTATTGGGGGSYEYPYDIIEMPEYDSVETVKRGYANRGFLTVFSPTETEIQNFKAYLFSSSADATIKKMYQSPIEAIVSFAMIPYPVPTLDTASRIYLGGTDSGVDSHLVQYQFITVDFGTIDIEKATRSFNDFSPRTDASIYLPYIGVHELDIDKIMGYQIGLKYYIDVVSGDFIAYLTLNGALDAGTPEYEAMIDSGLQSGVIGQWAGNCLIHVPISSLDFSSRIGATIGLMGAAVGTAAASAVGSPIMPMMVSQVGAMANQAIEMGKVTVKHKGAIPCTTGWLGIQKPYIMLTRPRLSIPESNNLYVGYPTNVYFELSDLTGYTEVQDIHLENVPATSDELDEIVKLLEGGVII